MKRSKTYTTKVRIEHDIEKIKSSTSKDLSEAEIDSKRYRYVSGSCGEGVKGVSRPFNSVARVLIPKHYLRPYQDNEAYIKQAVDFIRDCGFSLEYHGVGTIDQFSKPNHEYRGYLITLPFEDYKTNMDLFMGFYAVRYIYNHKAQPAIDNAIRIYQDYDIPAFECLQLGLLTVHNYYNARAYYNSNQIKPITREKYEKRLDKGGSVFKTFNNDQVKNITKLKKARKEADSFKPIDLELVLKCAGYDPKKLYRYA